MKWRNFADFCRDNRIKIHQRVGLDTEAAWRVACWFGCASCSKFSVLSTLGSAILINIAKPHGLGEVPSTL